MSDSEDLPSDIEEAATSAVSTLLPSKSKDKYKKIYNRTFTKEEIARFLKEADDKKFLLTKVGLVIGIAGACRKQELTNLLNEKVKDEGSVFHIEITTTKN
ncbi:hypothetical protein NQ315_004960 [Exocentrus adspersus]|uniref:Uncharacterized protein n=1 Tax=Exocentrus adspersus TaxID=1586481 RepID=A0AAV8V7C9_9CUCU|nr:hypothetical protein NQ315_004960 [Exocentrus adspersus]